MELYDPAGQLRVRMSACFLTGPKVFFVYMTASGPRGVIYVGMSSDLVLRAGQHRDRLLGGFTK